MPKQKPQFLNLQYILAPFEILPAKDISSNAKMVYIILYTWGNIPKEYRDPVWPTQSEIATSLNISRATVNQAIKELVEKKYLEIKRNGKGNKFHLLLQLILTNKKRV
jgi:DNA-binding MarR family transcriptional regulator